MALVAALSSTFVLRTLQVTSPYAPTPTGADRFAFGESDANRKNNMYYAEGYKGKGANPPVVRLNDNYKGSRSTYIAHGKYNYLHFPDGPPSSQGKQPPCGLTTYGKHYTTAEGRDGLVLGHSGDG